MKIGDRVTKTVFLGHASNGQKTGYVIYIHPQGFFYIAEFKGRGGINKYRESFYLPLPPDNPLKRRKHGAYSRKETK